MKRFFLLALLAFTISTTLASPVAASTRVHGYVTKRGTYVHSYIRSDRNTSKLDNWSTKGNFNPYTGKKGYKKIQR